MSVISWDAHNVAKRTRGIDYLTFLMSQAPEYLVDALADPDFIIVRVGLRAAVKLLRSYIYKPSVFDPGYWVDKDLPSLTIYSSTQFTSIHDERKIGYIKHMERWSREWKNPLWLHKRNDFDYDLYPRSRQVTINALYALQYHSCNPQIHDKLIPYLSLVGLVDIVGAYLAGPHINRLLQGCKNAIASLRTKEQPSKRRQCHHCLTWNGERSVCYLDKLSLCLKHYREYIMR